MTRTLRVKIRCPHCECKIDISAIEPESEVHCPLCEEAFCTPDEESYEELSVYPYSDNGFQKQKTHHFSTRRNIATKKTLRKMQKQPKKKPLVLFGGVAGMIMLLFLFAVSRQSLQPKSEQIVKSKAKQPERLKEFKTENEIQILGPSVMRPDNLNFQGVMSHIQKHLDSVDGVSRIYEKKRFNILLGIRSDLENGLQKYPYSGNLRLRSGQVEGQIIEFNEDGILINASSKELIPWKKVDVRAYADLLKFVALNKARNITAETSSGNLDLLHETAIDYFHAAVLLDWYGYKASSKVYKNLALQLSPKLISDTRELLP